LLARARHPRVDGDQLTDYAGILFLELRRDLADRYPVFRDALTLFDSGTAMACVTSTVAQSCTGSHASLTPEEQEAMGIHSGLVRLCFGLEAPEDLDRDLAAAFAALGRPISGGPLQAGSVPDRPDRARCPGIAAAPGEGPPR
jgi:cystathionine gamma-lyase/cystathionine gamma-lyase/homocysteine desulfhydrase